MTTLTLYDLMGEDHEIYAKMLDNKQVEISVLNESEDMVFNETSHVFAWDSLVSFAKQVLKENKKIEEDIEHE